MDYASPGRRSIGNTQEKEEKTEQTGVPLPPTPAFFSCRHMSSALFLCD